MSDLQQIYSKTRNYTVRQNIVDLFSSIVFTCATVIIAVSVALILLRSPWYGLIGLVPLLLYRPPNLMHRAKELETKVGLKGELVNSLQLAKIPADSKENYSQELIQAFIHDAASKIEGLDVTKYVNYTSLAKAARFVLIAMVFALIHPASFPAHFWYSLYHRIDYHVAPGSAQFPKDANTELRLWVWGVYIPKAVDLQLSTRAKTATQKLKVEQGIARSLVTVSDPLVYHFRIFEHETEAYEISPIEPLYITDLCFRLQYPSYTRLAEETRTGRQIVAPNKTVVAIKGTASQSLQAAHLEFLDTISLAYEGKDFEGIFVIKESGTAILHLQAYSELREPIRIYSIPDLAPLVDIFYPGTNVNLPYDMRLEIGLRGSDDYGLADATFHYIFEAESTKGIALKKGAFEDTVYFDWDLSNLGMLPGDEISYYAVIHDNNGQAARSNTYYVRFPTMEQMYDQVSEKETMLQADIKEMQAQHAERMEEISRIQEKLMKERELSWADQEQLGEAIRKEESIMEKITEWQSELEKTIEKLNEGIILDQKSMERLNEIARIMQEIAPEELRKALANMKMMMEKRPTEMPRALEDVQRYQEELAKALERSLEILKRYAQEEKLKELAERAQELSDLQSEVEEMAGADKDMLSEKQQEIDQGMEELIDKLNELAASEGLEQEISDALKQMAMQMQNMKTGSSKEKKAGLKNMAVSLQQLYEQLTQGRFANLRKNLLESLKQIIESSKVQEDQLHKDKIEPDQQQEIIQTIEAIAESLFKQQNKSFFVGPEIGKGLARATLRMQESQKLSSNSQASKMKATEAMKELNLVARDILFSLKMMEQGGSTTGMNSFMQQMTSVTDGMMMMSQALLNILPIPVQGLTAGQKAQLQRLAARQRELREALQALRGEAAAGRYQDMLDNMINEMQEIEQDLFQYKVSRELIERQKKVISKLLDTQRSIREEDYSKKRESKPGQDISGRVSPAPLTRELGRDELRELLQQELRKPYPKEYEIYIREYFRALLEEE